MKRVRRRHVIAEGWIGEWNLPPRSPRWWAEVCADGHTDLLVSRLFRSAADILGAKRRIGQRARRVRVVVEELA